MGCVMETKYPNVEIKLPVRGGNPFFIIGKAARALRNAGVAEKEVKTFRTECMSGDYEHVLHTCMRWVDVH
jgi:hypothetical protein